MNLWQRIKSDGSFRDEVIYYAIAIATFKHSSWSFGSTFEGPPPAPLVDMLTDVSASSIPGILFGAWALFWWYFWGALMALAVDAVMLSTAYKIRTSIQGDKWYDQKWILWLAYLGAVLGSGYTQMFYAAQHSAPMTLVPTSIPGLQEGGWLYWIFEYRIVVLPLVLPGTSFFYTIGKTFERYFKTEKLGRVVGDLKTRMLNVAEAALFTGYSEASIRSKAAKGQIGARHPDTNEWMFTEDELKPLIRKP